MKSEFENIKNKYKDIYLFKRDIYGKVIFWYAEVIQNTLTFSIASYYGQLKSGFTSSTANIISNPLVGMNLGKSNETTPQEQAFKTLESEYKDHIKKGYKSYSELDVRIKNCKTNKIPDISLIQYIDNLVDIKNTDALGYSQPMKFKPFYESDRKYPYACQYKFNGVRATQIKTSIVKNLFDTIELLSLSKEGITYTVNHLNYKLSKIINYLEDKYGVAIVLDGEYYLPHTPVTTIGGAARNIKNPINKKLQYIIYDLAIDSYSQIERLKMLEDVKSFLKISTPDNNNSIPDVYIATYCIVEDENQALILLEEALRLKYEGLIFRPLDKEYAFGKKPIWNRKLKKFFDAEFEIVDVIEYGQRTQKVGYGCKFICKNDITDALFEATVGGNDGTNDNVFTVEDKIKIVDNKLSIIGKKATIKFYERTKNGLPFHHNAIAIRDYEN